jgi:beta-1,4-mannosyltransferase
MNPEHRIMRVLAWPIQSPTNPYTPLLYSNLDPSVHAEEFSAGKVLEKYSVWHVHWPEALLNIRNPVLAASKVAGLFAAVDCLQMRGAKLVWTIHNCSSHEKFHPSLEAWFWRQFIPRVDGIISLSSAGLSNALESFPALTRIPRAVIPHGHYRNEYPQASLGARKMLGIPSEAKMLLFAGAVRSYKNVELLVRAFREISTPHAILHVVGSPNSVKLAQSILGEASSDDRVSVLFEFVEPEVLSAYVSAADLVVLPYREILNSGSALLALSLNRSILVPDLGAMGELKADFGDRWVRTFSGELDKAILESALDWAVQNRKSVCPMPEKYEWRSIGRETARFYGTVVSENLSQ